VIAMSERLTAPVVARAPTNRLEPLWLRFFFARLRTKPLAFFHICETIELLDAEPLKYQLPLGHRTCATFQSEISPTERLGIPRSLTGGESAKGKSCEVTEKVMD